MNFLNGLDFIQEFSKYADKYTSEVEFYHPKRNFFHPGYKKFCQFYFYDIEEQSLYLISSVSSNYIPTIYLHLTDIEKFVKFKIEFLSPNILRYYAEDNRSINYFMLKGYYKEEIAVETIIRYWKKFRWNFLKNLAAWKYHPSRLSFDV